MSGISLFIIASLGVVVLLWLQHQYPIPSMQTRAASMRKVTISLFDPAQWNADASLAATTLEDALQLVEVQVPSDKDTTLEELRGALLRSPFNVSAFAYLDVEHNCITPLSSFQETFTSPFDEDKGNVLLVGLTSEDELLHEYMNPPEQVMLWDMNRRKERQPIDFYAASDAGSRLYCRPWYDKFLLLKKLSEQRTYFHGLFEKSTGGKDIFGSDPIDKKFVSSFKYHGWRAVEDHRQASVLLGSYKQWKPTFAGRDPFILKAIINRNIYGLFGDKFKQVKALKKLSVEKPCVDLKNIIPATYSASDVDDCGQLKKIFEKSKFSSSNVLIRKIGNVHQGKGVELAHQMHPDDCRMGSLSGRSVNFDSMLNDDKSYNVFYQEMIDSLKINGRASSFRMNLLLASFDPLVALTNFQNGLMYINNREDKAWYTQGGSNQEYWTFEMLDEYMLEAHGISNFFLTHIYPQWQHIVDVILEILKPRVIGGKGHFELLCFDLMMSDKDYRLYLIEVNQGCGYFGNEKYINQDHMIIDTIPVIMEVQGRILSDRSVLDLVNGERIYMQKGNYELVYSNQPGASYERSLCLSNSTVVSVKDTSDALETAEHVEL